MSESNIDAQIRGAFDLLDTISEYEQNDLAAAYKDKSIRDSILMLNDELLENEAKIDVTSPIEFVKLVHELRNVKKTWAQNLSKSIMLETRKAKSGDIEAAVDVLKDFIKNCPSPFYRKMASRRMEYYKRK